MGPYISVGELGIGVHRSGPRRKGALLVKCSGELTELWALMPGRVSVDAFASGRVVGRVGRHVNDLSIESGVRHHTCRVTLTSLRTRPITGVVTRCPLKVSMNGRGFMRTVKRLPSFKKRLFTTPPTTMIPSSKHRGFRTLIEFRTNSGGRRALLLHTGRKVGCRSPGISLT